MTDLDLFKLQVLMISCVNGFLSAALVASIVVVPGMIRRYKVRRSLRRRQ